MKLISEFVTEDISINKDKNKNYYIEGIFLQAERLNKNNRIYPIDVLKEQVEIYNTEYIQTKRALGELNHPDTPKVNPERASHLITEIRQDGNNFYGKAKILSKMPCGSIVANLIDEGVKFGVSSRGLGELVKESDGVSRCTSYLLCAIDVVSDPSAPEAFVNGIMENKEWVYCDGVITEEIVSQIKKRIDKIKQNKQRNFAILFENFLRNL